MSEPIIAQLLYSYDIPRNNGDHLRTSTVYFLSSPLSNGECNARLVEISDDGETMALFPVVDAENGDYTGLDGYLRSDGLSIYARRKSHTEFLRDYGIIL